MTTKLYRIKVQPLERNVAAAVTKVRATSDEEAITKVRTYFETEAVNHITKLAASRYLRLRDIRYTVIETL